MSSMAPSDTVVAAKDLGLTFQTADGPVTAPDSFASISPFGTRRKESRGLHSSLDFPRHALKPADTVLKHRV